jgi:hypothetical protein
MFIACGACGGAGEALVASVIAGGGVSSLFAWIKFWRWRHAE